jgi:hypothetical protein
MAGCESGQLRQEGKQSPVSASILLDPTKLTRFPNPQACEEPEPVATEHSRVIVCIGSERYIFDFTLAAIPEYESRGRRGI